MTMLDDETFRNIKPEPKKKVWVHHIPELRMSISIGRESSLKIWMTKYVGDNNHLKQTLKKYL